MEANKKNKSFTGRSARGYRSMFGAVVLSIAGLAAAPSLAADPTSQPAFSGAAGTGSSVDLGASDPFAVNTPAPTTNPSSMISGGLDADGQITLDPGKSKKLTTKPRIKKEEILQEDVAAVYALSATELVVSGKKPGSTQLILTDENGQTEMVDINIESDVALLRKQLKSLFPDAKVSVDAVNNQITLRGQVPTLEKAGEIEAVAAPYGSKVVDLMEVAGGQQVMLRVRFAEINKTAERQLGVNFGGTDSKSFFGSNVATDTLAPVTIGGSSALPGALGGPSTLDASVSTLFGQGVMGNTVFQYFLEAMEQDNLLRMLAEPDLVTSSGQKASFLAGGEFPVPVPQAGGTGGTVITIDYKKYGVQLNFTPIVLGNGRIRLEVNPDVSELDFSTAVTISGTTVPGLTERNVNTTVELAEGQTFAIAGLLQNTITASTTAVPGLGDVPVLGALFSSVKYQRNETELVVLVTPVLVDAINPADVTPVAGENWRTPTESDLFFLHDLGGTKTDTSHGPQTKGPAPKFQGEYGFSPVQPAASK
jgi:pilus assembly protein CpaC